ncbi:MAG: hypothetical protein WCQ77_07385 [Planctomycetota bacterium]
MQVPVTAWLKGGNEDAYCGRDGWLFYRRDIDSLTGRGFLGDSFANIFSVASMGWGEGAGLAEHLSLALGLPVDAVIRNDAGSFATREMLAKELQRGNDRLAGKKLVIWCFAAREFTESSGWSLVPFSSVAKPAGTTP